MRLYTKEGDFSLPEDYTFEIEVNNPFFSDDGTADIGVTLPATMENLHLLGKPDRVSSANRFVKATKVILEAGFYQNSGSLIVSSAGEDIQASLALAESELYSELKSKSLKDVFSVISYSPQRPGGPKRLADVLYMDIYNDIANDVLTIFPVAVEKDGDSYKIMNEPAADNSGFVYEARDIKYGDDTVKVPDGYGVTPFIYLHSMIKLTFELSDYTIVRNDFENIPYRNITVLNNCSDSICRGISISYRDLVPSMTVGELITFLKDRFGAVVSMKNNEIAISLMQKNYQESPDIDLSSYVRGVKTIIYPQSSRVVLSNDTSLEGAEPAAKNLKLLKEQYATRMQVDSVSQMNKTGLFFIKALGQYWFNSENNPAKAKFIGSNNFPYDRENTDETEDHASQDLFAPMVISGGRRMPYIGDRLHYHTEVKGKKEEDIQQLLLCYSFFDSNLGHRCGTTQNISESGLLQTYLENRVRREYPVLTAEDYFFKTWNFHNNLLLNGAPEVSAQIDYPLPVLMTLDLLKPKIIDGQHYMIKSFTYTVSSLGIKCGKTKLQALSSYIDGKQDEAIVFDRGYKWKLINEFSQLSGDVSKNDYVNDYTMADVPDYTPSCLGIVEKRRIRQALRTIKRPTSRPGVYNEVDIPITYEEYFISVYADE